MSVVKMSKFTLTIFDRDKPSLFQALQAFEIVHFNDLSQRETWLEQGARRQETGVQHEQARKHLEELRQAIDRLSKYQSKEEQKKVPLSLSYGALEENLQSFDESGVLAQVRAQVEIIRTQEDRQHRMEEKKKELQHWVGLEMPLDWLHRPRRVRVRTGVMGRRWAEAFLRQTRESLPEVYAQVVSSDEQNQYLLILERRGGEELESLLRESNFADVELSGGPPSEQIAALEAEGAEAAKKIREAQAQLRALSQAHLVHLEMAYERAANAQVLVQAEDCSLRTRRLTFLEGYIPSEQEAAFRTVLSQTLSEGAYALQMGAASPEDAEVPTLLKNRAMVEPFENLVEMYSLPRYDEPDPTGLLMPWYMLFFGLMLGDLGYGLLLLLGTSLGLAFLPLRKSMRNMFRFFRWLSLPTIVAGLAFGSFFGGVIPLPSLIDPTESSMEMIFLSIVIGIVNIFTGLGIKAVQSIQRGRVMNAVYDVLFWYLLLGGALAFGLQGVLNAPSWVSQAAIIAMVLGTVGIVLFSARENPGIGRYTWGLYNLYGVTSYVGDIVSYTRIASLLLAGAFIGYAANLISGMVLGLGVAGIVPAVIIFIGFHLFNLFLSGLSAYVHSMRLIYVEFFGRFYEGGGIPFRKLRAKSKYIEID